MPTRRHRLPRVETVPYFTDREELIALFERMLGGQDPKRMLALWGVGGIGKSTLLSALCERCTEHNIVFARASGDSHTSVRSILNSFCSELAAQDVHLPVTRKRLSRLAAVERRITEAAKTSASAGTPPSIPVDAAGLAQTAIETVMEKGAEWLSAWLSRVLTRPDRELWEDPEPALTEAFLTDIRGCDRDRIVLVCDAFEKLQPLESWWAQLARDLPDQVLLVLSGREVPDWRSTWEAWRARANVVEVQAFPEDVVRALVRKQAACCGAEISDERADELVDLVEFAHGLPLAVTSAVELALDQGVAGFGGVHIAAVAAVVDRLMTGLPTDLIRALEAAATLRWFSRELLQALLPDAEVEAAYDELRGMTSFVRPVADAYAVHDCYRDSIDEWLRLHSPARHRDLHQRAARYYHAMATSSTIASGDTAEAEWLYHEIMADEETGLLLFRECAERYLHLELWGRLAAAVETASSACTGRASRLWVEYYRLRPPASWLGVSHREKLRHYGELAQAAAEVPLLRAYCLEYMAFSMSILWFPEDCGGPEEAIRLANESLQLVPAADDHLILNYKHLSDAHYRTGDTTTALACLESMRAHYVAKGNECGLVLVDRYLARLASLTGDWRLFIAARDRGIAATQSLEERTVLANFFRRGHTDALAYSGRYREAEEARKMPAPVAVRAYLTEISRFVEETLGIVLALQGRFAEAQEWLDRSVSAVEAYAPMSGAAFGNAHVYMAAALILSGRNDDGAQLLQRALPAMAPVLDARQSAHYWLGYASEVAGEAALARDAYHDANAEMVTSGYFRSGSLCGLVRVHHRLGDLDLLPALFVEAEELAQRYEYNDHLASLELSRAQLAWDGVSGPWGQGFDAALGHFQRALIFALRYNRFKLDEVLWGGSICTPLRPVIPYCRERGEDGQRMLEALRDWWQTGSNDIGRPRPDTISPLPEGIPLLEAEEIAREREPGDRSVQTRVGDALADSCSR